jgi:predicted DNA-binding WGR domain protein
MKLVRQTRLHFKEGNSDKVYEADLCDLGDGRFTVNFRYGRRGTDLKEGAKTSVPVARDEAEKIFQKLVDEKTRKGYHIVGGAAQGETIEKPKSAASPEFDEDARKNWILAKLNDAKAKSNPRIERIIWRAGELKIKEAAPPLINLLGTAKDLRDYCIAWSLGFCGDGSTTLPVLEKLAATHPSESVRRIAGEAIYKLADENLRARLREKAAAELPENLRNALESGESEIFETALAKEIENQKRGSFDVLTRLYQIENEMTRPVLLKILAEAPFSPRWFKPVRHIFKMAEYRRDAEVFGVIAKRFEIESAGYYASPWQNSVYLEDEDGKWRSVKRKAELAKEDSRLAYGSKTRDYFRRRTWRTLRRMGEIGDRDYVKMAVGALLAYTDADAREPRVSTFYNYYDERGNWNWQNPKITTVSWDSFSPYLLFNHILYQNSPRYEYRSGSRGFRVKGDYKIGDPPPAAREEAFPQLWNQQPAGLLHLLAESECRRVHEFAVRALRDCREFVAALDLEAISMLLSRSFEITNQLGFELAKARYEAGERNVELIVRVAVCRCAQARAEAFRWIDADRILLTKNNSAMFRLLTCAFQDTRRFAATLLAATNYGDEEAKNLIALLLAEILAADETKREIAEDLSDALLRNFGRELRVVNLKVVEDLLARDLPEAQILGANILLNHETPAANLPSGLINSLVESPLAEARAVGVKLFGRLADENLLNRESVLMAMLAHEFADIYQATRLIVARLAAAYPNFVENLSSRILVALLRAEKHEGVHERLLNVLRDLPDWTRSADFEIARLLVNSDSGKASETGGLILQNRAEEWRDEISTEEIVKFSDHEIFAVREAARKLAELNSARLREEVSTLVGALDTQWADSREFWFEFFRSKLTADELTPEILISVCDSVKEATQKFGRDLLLQHFQAENGAEYLLKLSEHPAPAMQLFATNYLETYAAGAPEKIERLAPYFVRVLSLVNRSRAAKDRVLRFLENEGLKSERAAKIVAEILARQSATVAVGDKARAIESMLKIRRKFPEIELPLKIKPAEVRQNAI